MVTFLSHFTPSMMPEDVIERIFVQRKRLASRLVTLIRESVLGTAKHHTLIVGPRGIGKTHLASLVYHRVRGMDDLADKMRIAWLREEEWGIASFLDFVIRVLRALDEGYPDAGLAARVESLFAHKPEHAEREAVALLDEFVGERTVFLITENLDQLFEGLSDVGQQQFRAYLQDRATWTILATAPGLFNGISLQSSPFYGFFRVHHLRELSVDEAVELLQKIAELSDREELASFVETPVGRARIRAVHHLAGGNHRIYVIFSEFLTRETLDDLVEPFLTTMDHLTPYYQARMQSLSPQMRKIVDYLCEVRHAVPVKEIAQRCFITQQTASAQLKILKERGFARSFNLGRESYYELLEPLLRLSLEVKKQRGEPIRLFVDFLRYWYSKPELEQRLLDPSIIASANRDYFRLALDSWDAGPTAGEPYMVEWEHARSSCAEKEDYAGALEFAESLVRVRGNVVDHLEKTWCLLGLEMYDDAVSAAQEIARLAPDLAQTWVVVALAEYGADQFGRALESIEKAHAIGELSPVGWSIKGDILQRLLRNEEAVLAYTKAIELAPEDVGLRLGLMAFLQRLERYEEALQIAGGSLAADPSPPLLDARGKLLEALKRFDEAASAYRAAADLEESAVRRFNLGRILIIKRHFEDAEKEIRRSLDLNPAELSAWAMLCLMYTLKGDQASARSALESAASLRPSSAAEYSWIGHMYTGMSRYQEAAAAYRECLNIDPDHVHAKIFIVAALAGSENWTGALSALRDALEADIDFAGNGQNVSRELLKFWFRRKPTATWASDFREIASTFSEFGVLPLLSSAVAMSLEEVVAFRGPAALSRHWIDAWLTTAEIYPELEIGVRLLHAGMEYHFTGDGRYLLDLASEERALVESIPGIRPLPDPP